MKKFVFTLFLALIFLGGIFFYQYSKYNDGNLHIVFCNVGQGDGIFIRTPKGANMLIDSGPDDSILSCISSHTPFWDKTISVAILTHPHADHLTGFISVLKSYKVLGFYSEEVGSKSLVFQNLEKQLQLYHVPKHAVWKGDSFSFDKGKLYIEWPTREWVSRQGNAADLDLNGLSVVALLIQGNLKILFTGDASTVVMDKLTQIGSITILKVPHHGSRTGLDEKVLQALEPKLAVISVGAHNKYGHPHKETLALLDSFKIPVLRTDQKGDIEVISDGNKVDLKHD